MNATGSKQFTVVINPSITVNTSALTDWTAGFAGYNQMIAATGGTGTLTYTAPSVNLPPGLTLSAAGVLSGTPTTVGSYTFLVTVTDSVGATGTKSYTINVNAALAITTTGLVNWTAGFAGYSQQLSVTGGTGTVLGSAISASLPPGLTFSSTGLLAGTPTTAGTYTFLLTATDSVGSTVSKSFMVVISAPVSIATSNLANWTNGFAGYSQTVTATGGTGTLTFSTNSGNLPPGITLSSGGVVSGMPSAEGTYVFQVTATDTVGASSSKSFTIIISPVVSIVTSSLPNWTAGKSGYSQLVTATGGTVSVTLSAPSNLLPPGLTFSNAGFVSGAPTTPGTYTFTVTAVDTVGASGTKSFTIVINPALAITTNATLANAKYKVAYTPVTLTTTGGTGTLTYSATNTPAGLALSTAGVLSGTATVVGTFTVQVTVTDSVGAVATKGFSITITEDPPHFVSTPVITPSSAVTGETVTVTVGAVTTDDGNAAVITVNFGDGVIATSSNPSHIYAVTGTYTIVVTATSSGGSTATYSQTISIGVPFAGGGGEGNVIGKSGLSVKLGFGGKYTVNFISPSKSIITSRLVLINFPTTLAQNDLVGAPGVLTIGTGVNAVTYPFALTAKGNEKPAGQLASIAVSVKDKVAQFTSKGDARLVTLAESLGVTPSTKSIKVLVPVTIQISTKVYIAAQLEMIFVNPVGKTAAGKLTQ